MENYLRQISINGLFEEGNNYKISLTEGCNCIYGGNGTGKTTVINLIVSSMSCDIEALAQIPFEEITLYTAKTTKKRAERFINITKTQQDEDLDLLTITISGNVIFREPLPKRNVEGRLRKKYLHATEKGKSEISETINLTHVPLLRIHDSEMIGVRDERAEFIHRMLDAKHVSASQINEIIDPSVRVLSMLQRQFLTEANENRKRINNGLETLKSKIIEKVMIDDTLVKMSSKALKKAHNAITSQLEDVDVKAHTIKLREAKINVPEEKIQEHFTNWKKLNDNVRTAWEALQKNNTPPPDKKKHEIASNFNNAYYSLIAMANFNERFLSIVADVEAMQGQKLEITKHFIDYENEVNKFLSPRKTFTLNDDGQFKVSTPSRKIELNDLSSGEKHIVTILGKSALSRKDGSVFIADEPELSLHLDWQRMILPSIMKLSPKSQIIVATHSPAITAEKAHEIDLEECKV